jgi:hypothetical protein
MGYNNPINRRNQMAITPRQLLATEILELTKRAVALRAQIVHLSELFPDAPVETDRYTEHLDSVVNEILEAYSLDVRASY